MPLAGMCPPRHQLGLQLAARQTQPTLVGSLGRMTTALGDISTTKGTGPMYSAVLVKHLAELFTESSIVIPGPRLKLYLRCLYRAVATSC